MVGAGSVVEAAATLALVESVEADDPPHAVNINRAIGANRFNMMMRILWLLQCEMWRSTDIS